MAEPKHISNVMLETNDILDICSDRRQRRGMELRALGRLLGAHPVVAASVALLLHSELGAAPWDILRMTPESRLEQAGRP